MQLTVMPNRPSCTARVLVRCTSEPLRGLGHRAIDLLLAGDVGDQRNDLAARLALQLARRGLEPIFRARDDRHIDALAGELERDRLADAETAAGHERAFAFQSKIHR